MRLLFRLMCRLGGGVRLLDERTIEWERKVVKDEVKKKKEEERGM